jgi:hypothetical protein
MILAEIINFLSSFYPITVYCDLNLKRCRMALYHLGYF